MGPRTLRLPRGGQVWRHPTSRLLGLDRAGRRWTRSWLLETETALLVVKAEMALVDVMAEVKAEMHLAVVMVVRLGLRGHATIDLAHATAQRRWMRRSWQSRPGGVVASRLRRSRAIGPGRFPSGRPRGAHERKHSRRASPGRP